MTSIPRILHFIWIQGDRPFGKGEWVSLMSALKNTGYQVMLHTDMFPEDVKEYDPLTLKMDRYTCVRHLMSHTVHGVKARMANLSDIWRIKVLHEYGGIYSDLDIIWFREVDFGPFDYRLVTAYENPSYKTAANAFIAAAKGDPRLATLEGILDGIFESLAKRGITDLTVNPVRGLSKHHVLLWKPTGDFMKANADHIFGKQPFYKNGWRRIGRKLRNLGVALKPVVDLKALEGTDDRIDRRGITGFHYYATLYDYDQIRRIPDLEPLLLPVEVFAETARVSAKMTAT
jgi:hypothetical protein